MALHPPAKTRWDEPLYLLALATDYDGTLAHDGMVDPESLAALRRLKKRIDREGTLREVRNHRHYEKPSERKRRKMKVARFSAMLSARYADL